MVGAENKQHRKYSEFVSDFFKEIRKVIWPTPKITFKNTWVTLVMIFLVGVFVFLIDLALMNLLGLVMNISQK